MAASGNGVEKRLWAAADQLWANTGLKPAEFSTTRRTRTPGREQRGSMAASARLQAEPDRQRATREWFHPMAAVP